MPDDTTESVAEHSSRLQPLINLHAPVTACCSGIQKDEGLSKPCAVNEAL